MTKYVIQGGKPLFGEVEISGAKNAAVAILPAALLVDGVCRIENIPQISDVHLFFTILDELGASVRSINPHTVEINCTHIRSTRTSYEMARRIRASYYLIGALLGRFARAEVAMKRAGRLPERPVALKTIVTTEMARKVAEFNGVKCFDTFTGFKFMKKLRENGYISVAADGTITLNDSGMEIASRIYGRHKTLTELFAILGVSPKIAAEDACKVEHDLNDETFARITEFVERSR